MVKIYLKNPNLDVDALIIKKHIFGLQLERGLKIPNISKDYDNPALRNLLAIKIKGENVKLVPVHQLLAYVVLTRFYKGQEFKITQVNKVKDEDVAYFTGASSKDCKKTITY